MSLFLHQLALRLCGESCCQKLQSWSPIPSLCQISWNCWAEAKASFKQSAVLTVVKLSASCTSYLSMVFPLASWRRSSREKTSHKKHPFGFRFPRCCTRLKQSVMKTSLGEPSIISPNLFKASMAFNVGDPVRSPGRLGEFHKVKQMTKYQDWSPCGNSVDKELIEFQDQSTQSFSAFQ